MKEKLISKDKLQEWLRALESGYEVVAPVAAADGPTAFAPLAEGMQPVLDNAARQLSPKEYVLPRCEKLFTYRQNGAEPRIEPGVPEAKATVVFGAHPCDVQAMNVLDRVFLDGRFHDPYYQARREKMVTVAYMCERKRWSCFCASVGDPVEWAKSADAAVTDLGGSYSVVTFTEKGEALVSAAEALFSDAEQGDIAKRESAWTTLGEAEEHYDPATTAAHVDWNEPAWDEIAERCIGCGVCSFMCPTCTCFDIQDETLPGGAVERFRVRDTCQFCDFTKMGAGHNPRPGRKERARQRLSHKFRYILKQCGVCGCVGCGRCVELCPVNSDIRKVLKEITSEDERQSVSA